MQILRAFRSEERRVGKDLEHFFQKKARTILLYRKKLVSLHTDLR